MLTGKELILATRPYAREHRGLSWFYTLSTLALLILCLSGTLLLEHWALRLTCSVLSSLMITRMFVIYHDHQHHAILNRSFLANVIMTLFGLYMLAPSSIWKRSHDYHHKHNSKLFSSSIGSYLILTKKKFLSLTKYEQRAYLATRHPLTILFGYITMFMVGMCLNSFLSRPGKHFDSLIAMVLHIAGSVLTIIFLGWDAWLFFILIPFFLTDCLGAYLFYAQHNFPGVRFKDNIEWSYDNAALQSSSYMVLPRFLHWVTANIGYHHVHHMNSRIPFYRLPEVMRIFPELQNVNTTSLKPKDIIACLKLKLWDAENNQMIPLKVLKDKQRGQHDFFEDHQF